MKTYPYYKPFSRGCIRVTGTAFETYLAWSEACARSELEGLNFLLDFFKAHNHNLALYAASPSLWSRHANAINSSVSDIKDLTIGISLASYFSRMCSRSTPFGTFTAVGGFDVEQNTDLNLKSFSDWQVKARLDSEVMYRLSRHYASKHIRNEKLKYVLNSTLVKIGRNVRYYETVENPGGGFVHKLTNIAISEPVDAVMILFEQASFKSYTEIVSCLVLLFGCEHESAIELFITDLINSQILVSNLTLPITETQSVGKWLVDELGMLDTTDAAVVNELVELCATIESNTNPIQIVVDTITKKLEQVGIAAPINIVQLDQIMKESQGALGTAIMTEVNDAIKVGHFFAGTKQRGSLDKFRDDFVARYGTHFVPILEALDEECGLGYNGSAAPDVGILSKINWSTQAEQVQAPSLLNLVIESMRLQGECKEVDLSECLDRAYQKQHNDRCPEVSSVIIQVHANNVQDLNSGDYLAEVASGTVCGSLLINRFAYASDFLNKTVYDLAVAEQERHASPLVELVYKPTDRMANISIRPSTRNYEIELLAQSSADPSKRLRLADILIGVVGNRIVLWSKTLQQEIIVRHSTAYNSGLGSNLGVFQFLCTLQWQNQTLYVGSSLFSNIQAKYVPRIIYKRVLLARARWTIEQADLAVCRKKDNILQAMNDLREQYCLPRFILVGTGDNKIIFDLSNPLSSRDFLKRSKSTKVSVEEAFPRDTKLWAKSNMGHHAAEFVLPIVRVGNPIFDSKVQNKDIVVASPRFSPGSEWLSIKVFSGTHTRERIISEVLPNVVKNIDEHHQWFFIRYSESGTHLRFRVRGPNSSLVMRHLYSEIEARVGHEYIHRIEADVYVPETYRYGGAKSLKVVESIFQADSAAALSFSKAGGRNSDERLAYCVASITTYLDAFGYTLEDQRTILGEMQRDMYSALSATGATRGEVGKLYRDTYATALEALRPDNDIFLEFKSVADRSLMDLSKAADNDELTVSKNSLVRSLIHMSLNRILTAYSREQEAVIYDLLYRNKVRQIARSKASNE